MNIKISLITVVFNNKDYILDCLNSLASQTYTNFEHIVVDGGSSDGTLEILKANKAKIDVLISEPDEGVCDAWNKGVALSSGDVVGFLHSDDVFFDDYALEKIAREFIDKDIDATYADLVYVTRDSDKVVRRWYAGEFDEKKIDNGWMPPHPTLFVTSDIYKKIGKFDLSFKISGDYLSILRIFKIPNLSVSYIPNFLVKMRLGGVSNKPSNLFNKALEDYRALKTVGYSRKAATYIYIKKNLTKIPQFFFRGSNF